MSSSLNRPSTDPQARVKALYYIMQSMEGRLGGGEGIEGLYGSITRSGMQKVLDALAKSCDLTEKSHIIDVGAGLGRPLLHALVNPGVAQASGIEIDRIKCNKAAAFLKHTIQQLEKRASGKALLLPRVECSSIEQVKTLDPGTHAYSFWEGVPPEGKCAFGRLFYRSSSMKSVAVVQRAMRKREPAEELEEMGFGPLVLVGSFPVSMSGSGRSFTAYIFNKRSETALEPDALEAIPLTPAIMDKGAKSSASDLAQPSDEGQSDALGTRLQDSASHECYQKALPAAGGIVQQVSTPASISKRRQRSKGLPNTPTSSGLSGSAMRVPLQDAQRMEARGAEGNQNAEDLSAASVGAGLHRRSARLRKLGEEALRGASHKHPGTQKVVVRFKAASPKKEIQKAKSPQKSLEALGFRTRRTQHSRKGKQLSFENADLPAHGLENACN